MDRTPLAHPCLLSVISGISQDCQRLRNGRHPGVVIAARPRSRLEARHLRVGRGLVIWRRRKIPAPEWSIHRAPRWHLEYEPLAIAVTNFCSHKVKASNFVEL